MTRSEESLFLHLRDGQVNVSVCVSLMWKTDGIRMHCGRMFCSVTLGSDIHVDVTLTCTTYLNNRVDLLHLFTAMVFPNVNGLFQQDNVPCYTAKVVQEYFTENKKIMDLATPSKVLWSPQGRPVLVAQVKEFAYCKYLFSKLQ